ncbi:putative Calcium motive p-type ATPase [Leptomonas seymouri]|uniref:Putative Calcium motive P-type ATPase n=1 Tax=Leptomonas seymouri TaxID=5684 RepID=A0A0N1PFH3_LEPSE|nr:putative Calcium motive p-type ATPase [Leptomonas seymouri]|eukprot:KPI88812.1 putative Calcium motive p-type ATPase [Leptomonas seymouri]
MPGNNFEKDSPHLSDGFSPAEAPIETHRDPNANIGTAAPAPPPTHAAATPPIATPVAPSPQPHLSVKSPVAAHPKSPHAPSTAAASGVFTTSSSSHHPDEVEVPLHAKPRIDETVQPDYNSDDAEARIVVGENVGAMDKCVEMGEVEPDTTSTAAGRGGIHGDGDEHAMNFGDNQGDEPTPESYDPANKFWTLRLENVFNLVQLEDPLSGLDNADAPRHAKALGDNIIPISGGPSWILILMSQFKNAITIVLLIVIIISGIFKDWAEFGIVLFVLLFNAFLGFYQEYGAEKSLASLKQMTAGTAKVMRSGVPEIIFIDEVVVGDVIVLEQGALVPADCRIFESNGLEVDEALLTGEAMPVVKHANVIRDPDNRLALGDRKNMVYRNTLVTQGRGKAVVVAGGLHTEMGKLAKRLSDGKGGGKTDLMKKLDYMMYFLFLCCAVLAVVVFGANHMKYTPSTLSYATAVAIAILPESLCVVITVAMTVSVKRMAQQKCIVRKLPVLEVLGNVTDICSDKTGTLTENKMVVKKAVIGVDDIYSVGGAPYDTYGEFFPPMKDGVNPPPVTMSTKLDIPYIYEFMKCCALCSTTALHISEEDADTLVGNGNPTEIAIQVMTWKASLNRDRLEEEGWECITEYAFDSKIKRMSTAWENKAKGDLYLCTKGAPERVIELCNYKLDDKGNTQHLTKEDRAMVDQHIKDLAAQGLRTICLSYRKDAIRLFPIPANEPFIDVYGREQVEQDLVFLGIVGIYDPPRPESRPSVIACQHAGIRVRMLTGDHTSTAGSIASMLNIISHRDLDDPVKLQAGPDFDKVDPDTIDSWADLPVVVGRCSPESKVRMIEALHRRKRVVAMTGDGFNDSPSIKIADIGCAMGSGVDVTKSVADLVITDDNFSTIVKAVAEGRRISQCIRKFVVHLLSSNVAEVIALICGLPISHDGESVFILSPIEILWLNMFTSSPPATGLSLDKATDDVLQVPPNTAGFFTTELIADTVVYGFWLGSITLAGFAIVLYAIIDGPAGTQCNNHRGTGCSNIWRARCTAFGILYFGLLLHAYTVRHPRLSIFKMRWFDNKWIFGSCILGTVLFVPIVYIKPVAEGLFLHEMITWEWAVIAIGVILFVAACEIYKVIKNCAFPMEKVLIEVDEEGENTEEQRLQEYNTFTRTMPDNRSVEEIANEDLRMSFASHAGGVATASTGSFRMPAQRQKKKRKYSSPFHRR